MKIIYFRKFIPVLIILIIIIVFLKKENEKNKVIIPVYGNKLVLADDDISFGVSEVSKMLQDRPKMCEYVRKGDSIYEWAVRQFAGESSGSHIFWDASAPDCPADCLASSTGAQNGHGGVLKIREFDGGGGGIRARGDELWAAFVFEMNNFSSSQYFRKNYDDAISGHINKKEWVIGQSKIEFSSSIKTKKFYESAWLPNCKNIGKKTDPNVWYENFPNTFEEWLKNYNDEDGYPYSFYGPEYDSYIKPYLQKGVMAQ